MNIRHQGFRPAVSAFAVLLAALLAPTALAQAPLSVCGVPPQPMEGSIPFSDITTQLGYQTIASPTSDTMSDYVGGYDTYCYLDDQDYEGPWATPRLAGSISLPFPFGFSGIYSDGGPLSTPFQVNVWANGILTFDPTVSFNPFVDEQQLAPPGCVGEYFEDEEINFTVNNGTVSDTLGGFPFTTKYTPPDGPPSALIAPWWGDLSLCPKNGSVGWLLTLDDDGQPMAIIQWTNATSSPAPPNCGDDCYGMIDFSSCTNPSGTTLFPGAGLPQFTFQVRLHQNNDVDFIYGPSSNLSAAYCYAQAVGACTYVSGIQSNIVFPLNERPPSTNYYVTAGFDCGVNSEEPGCAASQFPARNTSVTYHDVFRSVGPDVYVTGMSAPDLLPQGGIVTVPVMLSNGGGNITTGEGQLQFYFSAGGNTPQGSPFSVQNIASLGPIPACETPVFPAQVAIPASVAPGPGYLIAEFIPGAESIDQTPSYASAAVVVGPPEPDLAAEGNLGFSPASVVTGEPVTFNFTVANVGEVATPATAAYGIYASLGGAISTSDIQIGGGILPVIAAGQPFSPPPPSFPLPLTMVSGEYLVGVIVDPTNTLGEVNLSNNIAVGKKLMQVTSLGPVIATTSLPKAETNAPYSTQLIAGGGDGTYVWSLAAGSLPGGLTLNKKGIISGQATQAGNSGFTVKVTDGTNHSATQALTLDVGAFEQTLAIVTQALPGGATSRLYGFTLAAVGGTPPYQWALDPGTGDLPEGINLISNGTLSGQPQYDETTSFKVTVTDSAGTIVTSPLYQLTIFSGGALAVGSTLLPPAILNVPYSTTLHYAGGSGPYQWSIQGIVQEPEAPGDQPTSLGASTSVLGMTFDSLGVLGGVPTQVGVFAISVQLSDSETPPASATGLVLLTISATTTFQFLTVQLPPAQANSLYQTTLATNAASSDNTTFEVLNDAQLATELAKTTLPAGLTLYSNGLIQGVPLETGSFPFLVEASDGLGGVATQSFTITVQTDQTLASGCQSAPGVPAFGALLLLAALTARRRAGRERSTR